MSASSCIWGPETGCWLTRALTSRRRVQPALEYLQRIGHNPASSVRLIVATHWHDDHIRGLAEVVRTCAAADFYCSSALRTNPKYSQ